MHGDLPAVHFFLQACVFLLETQIEEHDEENEHRLFFLTHLLGHFPFGGRELWQGGGLQGVGRQGGGWHDWGWKFGGGQSGGIVHGGGKHGSEEHDELFEHFFLLLFFPQGDGLHGGDLQGEGLWQDGGFEQDGSLGQGL